MNMMMPSSEHHMARLCILLVCCQHKLALLKQIDGTFEQHKYLNTGLKLKA